MSRRDTSGKVIEWGNQLYAEDPSGNLVPVKVNASGEILNQLTGSYVGYSTDTKSDIAPNPNRGDEFLELDSKNLYIYDGTGWVLFS